MNYKKKAFDLMKSVKGESSNFPNYFSPISNKEHFYFLISFMAAC